MRQGSVLKRAAGLILASGLGLSLSGCGNSPDGGGITDTMTNLLVFNSTKAPAYQNASRELAVECPAVQVAEGKAAYRVYGNAAKTNDSVRYQFSFSDMSRDCVAEDGQIRIRVGVSGFVVAGPTGGTGTFSVPVHVVVKRDSNDQVVQSKVIRVSAAIAPGEAQAGFAVVTDPLVVPYLRPEADQDYSIYVGFDPNGAAAEKPKRKPRRG